MNPLVTIAVFAYNQEGCVADAIEGAFGQTYEPLEVILSDDCSEDRTYEIMAQAADNYCGPHMVRLNRNEKNLNIGGHIKRIADLAQGEVVVMAAGDDVSHSSRVCEHVELYKRYNDAYAVFSGAVEVSQAGDRVEKEYWFAKDISYISKYQVALRGGGIGPGATYSYKKDCFFLPYRYPESFLSEDRLLPFRASILGRVFYLPYPLVDIRLTGSNVSRNNSYVPSKMREADQAELSNNLDALLGGSNLRSGEFRKISAILKSNPRRWSPKSTSVLAPVYRIVALLERVKIDAPTEFRRMAAKFF